MPNIITHVIFAQEVYKQEKNAEIASIIERNSHLYAIGANGPDFLFFSHAKPWEAYKSHELNRLGSKLHAGYVNAFYTEAVRSIRRQTITEVRKDMMAYLFGHLCHWALDMVTHPYVFYCTGKNSNYHHRFESMIDAIVLKEKRGQDISQWHSYDTCTFDEDMLKAIARIYVPAARNVFGLDIKVHDLRETLNSWRDIQKLLYDPNGRRYRTLNAMETLLRQKWMFSGNIVPAHIDTKYDVMNEKKRFWVHPCDDQISSNASFNDLFDEAVSIAVDAIQTAFDCIVEGKDIEELCNFLKDRAYDTGMSGDREMKFFNIIYEEEKNAAL